jgi:putative ABC transport system permease protein
VRLGDILRLAVSALYQQKVRTTLTTLGVVIGTFVLIVSLSVGQGAQETIMGLFRRFDRLRKIEVWPNYQGREADTPPEEIPIKGDMSEAKRERLREAIRWRDPKKSGRGSPVTLNPERLRQLAALDHVVAVTPYFHQEARAVFGGKTERVVTTVEPDNTRLRDRVVAGDYFAAPGGRDVLVSEYLLYLWGVTDDARLASVLGQPLRLEFHTGRVAPGYLLFVLNAGDVVMKPEEERVLEKALRQLPAALDRLDLKPEELATLRGLLKRRKARPEPPAPTVLVEEFTIRGVVRMDTGDERMGFWDQQSADADVILPARTAEEVFFRIPFHREDGFQRVTVTVDAEENVKEVAARIDGLGLAEHSLVEVVERVRLNVLMLTFATTFVALVALVVAALGITNTMLMSVLERTHEIGVMKAVGARDRHVQLIFLVEGALIGLVGGGLGLLLGWLAAIPGDAASRSLVEKQIDGRFEGSMFLFPVLLTLGVPALACLVTTLAAFYPARRAARVNPITALRHE